MEKSRFICKNSPNVFCFICGKYCVSAQRKVISEKTKRYYSLYFGRVIENEQWAPNICCNSCEVYLNAWWNGTREHMPFAMPMVWKKQRNHRNDCCFCMTNVSGFSSKSKQKIVYAKCKSATMPISHSDSLPVPMTPNEAVKKLETDDAALNDSDPDYIPEDDPHDVHLVDQSELNDLVRDLGLSKEKAELLASRCRQWNWLKDGTKVTYYRDRTKPLMKFFKSENSICYCQDIDGLLNNLGIAHKPDEWRLFIDGSTESLKAALVTKNQLFH